MSQPILLHPGRLTGTPSAYERMARFGLGPASSARDVKDASFAMTPEDERDPAVALAWEDLRLTARRLAVDLWSLEIPASGPVPPTIPPRERRQLPVALLVALAADLPHVPVPDEPLPASLAEAAIRPPSLPQILESL
jgi:hypothetical protein